ncbi:MAG TPA: bifunctional 3,4-dihydroxy-2-butanone-4-phosphate synthase/GTP cyclohydrolase II, partial [Thiothrix sp.]|nr:bifunctional 3,4-dihydroxy-2-butanone-4-phosphate synthase/GTP cyclohydrolase II [Thiothrix sp.]
EKHQLKIGTIENLIRYRVKNEKTVERIQENMVDTVYGEFKIVAFREKMHQQIHLAMIKGTIDPDKETLVRVHIENELCDMLSLKEEACGWPLRNIMQRMADAEQGVIIILRNLSRTEDLLAKLNHLEPQNEQQIDKKKETTEDVKTFGIGAQMLSELGVQKMLVMSAPKRYHGLAGFGLEIVDYVQGS